MRVQPQAAAEQALGPRQMCVHRPLNQALKQLLNWWPAGGTASLCRTLACRAAWQDFSRQLAAAEQAVKAAEGGLAFSFVEGALIRAVRKGWWVLLDEINLAPPEVSKLQWPCGCRWWQGTKCKRRGWCKYPGCCQCGSTPVEAGFEGSAKPGELKVMLGIDSATCGAAVLGTTVRHSSL